MVTKIDIDNVYILQNKWVKNKINQYIWLENKLFAIENIDSQTHILVSKE